VPTQAELPGPFNPIKPELEAEMLLTATARLKMTL
jgi:hypothetical protein